MNKGLNWIKFHIEWFDMINSITDNGERLQWYDAIANFVLNGEQPPSVPMRLITEVINKEVSKAEEISAMRSTIGKKGLAKRYENQQDNSKRSNCYNKKEEIRNKIIEKEKENIGDF